MQGHATSPGCFQLQRARHRTEAEVVASRIRVPPGTPRSLSLAIEYRGR